MAQDITLLGASYEDVPAVELPKTGGGTASFTDVTDSTVTADDVMGGVTFYAPDGTKGTGKLANATLGQGYGSCNSGTATNPKVVTLSGYELVKGGIIAVNFAQPQPTIGSSSLNVNSQGAKSVKMPTDAPEIKGGDIAFFMYDGTYYRFLGINRAVITGTELTSLETKLGL